MERPPSAYKMWLNSGGLNIIKAEFPNENAAEQAKQADKMWDKLDRKTKQYWEDQHEKEYKKFRNGQEKARKEEQDKAHNQRICEGQKKTKIGGSSVLKKTRLTKKNPVVKLKLDENAIKKKVECAKKDKKVSRVISKEAQNQSSKSSIIKAYEYKGKGPLMTFGGVHNKHGAKITNSITIPLDVLPIAGTTKASIIQKCEGKNTSDVSHFLKIHPDKAFGYSNQKMYTGTRILSSIDKDLVDEKGLPKTSSKGAKPKKSKTSSPLMFATETEKYCVAASVIRRIKEVATKAQKRMLFKTFSKVSKRHPYQKMEDGVDRAVMQALSDYCKDGEESDLESDMEEKDIPIEMEKKDDTDMEHNTVPIEDSSETVLEKQDSDDGGKSPE